MPVFKIMPQYLRQSNMKLTKSDMFPLVKCLQYEMSHVALNLFLQFIQTDGSQSTV